jgi:hypothetical protein
MVGLALKPIDEDKDEEDKEDDAECVSMCA